ncbi:MAG: hypothetical protein IT428_26135 [Planctomycetaceae bacterium]|nr:hypothetical protein [Planctomycetaceae bacterium]
MPLTVSAVTWPLSSVEAGYVVLSAVGVFGSLFVLVQTRKHAAAEKTGAGSPSPRWGLGGGVGSASGGVAPGY